MHLHEPQAGTDRPRAGHPAQRRPGLRVHGGRWPLTHELLARRRLEPDAFQHEDVHGRPGAGRLLHFPDRPGRLAPRDATCDDGSPVSNIDVGPGETVTCTFTDDERGTIVVVKDAVPNDPQDFAFTAGGGLSPASFSLDDDSDGTLSNTHTFADVNAGIRLLAGRVAAEQLEPGERDLRRRQPSVEHRPRRGETVTCTFLNQRGYPRPKGATPLKASLVPAFTACVSPNRVHGPSLEVPSCNPPALTSSNLTIGSPDANGRQANMSGAVSFEVMLGNAATPADEADVGRRHQRHRRAPEPQPQRLHGPALGVDHAADHGSPQRPHRERRSGRSRTCRSTSRSRVPRRPASTIGATCSLSTTADAVLPGMVTEIKRTIWQIGDVRIFDGGPDGQASTQDNTLFLRQGVFVP